MYGCDSKTTSQVVPVQTLVGLEYIMNILAWKVTYSQKVNIATQCDEEWCSIHK